MRFFVGNLVPEVETEQLEKIFNKYGKVEKVEIKNQKDDEGNINKTFAFVQMKEISEQQIRSCLQSYNGLRWHRQTLKVQVAQESFLQRLEKERKEAAEYDPMEIIKKRIDNEGGGEGGGTKDRQRWGQKQSQQQGQRQRRVYYSSSSEEEDEDGQKEKARRGKMAKPGGLLENLEKMDFWKDDKRNSDRENIDRRRKEALKERQSQLRKQKEAIRSSLSATDSKAKKSRFDIGDEPVNKASLFGNDDEDEGDDDDDETPFAVKPQFQGQDGEKLLSLQTRFAGDARFKIDERFAGDVPKGKKTKKLKEKDSKNFKDLSLHRFDPSKAEDRRRFELLQGGGDDDDDETIPQELSFEAKNKSSPEAAHGVSDKSFWVKREAFEKQGESEGGGGFSFGFGKDASETSISKKLERIAYREEPLDKSASTKKKTLSFLDKNPFKYDSSDSDDDDNEVAEQKVEDIGDFGRKLAEKSLPVSSEPFFFHSSSDKRFQEGLEFLAQSESASLDEIREKFDLERPRLASIMKRKMKKKAKRIASATARSRSKKRKPFQKRKAKAKPSI